ncbi:MAG: hypothetical protein MR375_01700 [Veillonellaceae bacterium]|nr:hypothetical protein [Veillonellaceae bacterium]
MKKMKFFEENTPNFKKLGGGAFLPAGEESLDGTTEELTGQIDGAAWDAESQTCKIQVSDTSGMKLDIDADANNNIGEQTCTNIGTSMKGKTATFNSKFNTSKDENGKTSGKLSLSGNLFLIDENRQPIGIESYYSDVDAKAILGKLAYQPTQATISSTGATYPLYRRTNGKWYNQDFTEVDPEAWKAETGIDLNDMTLGKDGRVYTKDGKDLTGNGFQDTNIKDMKAKAYEHESREYMPEGSAVSRIMGFFDTNKKEGESQKAVETTSSKSNDATETLQEKAAKITKYASQSATDSTTSTKAKVADSQKKSTVDKVKDFANHAVNSVTSYASKFGIDIKKFTKTGDMSTITGQNMAKRAQGA